MQFQAKPLFESDAPMLTLASAMAKSGRLTQAGEESEVPSITLSEKTETTTPAPASPSAETATATPNADKETPSSPSPEIKTETVETQKETPVKVQSWQEVLKSQQPDAVLKELGFDDSAIGLLKNVKGLDPKMGKLLEHWQTNGNVKEYLKALETDYSKMTPEEVMRHQLREQNPELSAQEFETLFRVKVVNRYKLDPDRFTEDEIAEGRIEMIADSKPVRENLLKHQNDFLLPKSPEPKAVEASNEDVKQQQEFESDKSQMDSDPYTRGVFEANKISFGEGEDKFNFPITKEDIQATLYTEQWSENWFKDVGGKKVPNAKHRLLVATVNKYGEKFLEALFQHAKGIGGKTVIEPIDNASKVDQTLQSKAEQVAKTPAEAAAKYGTVTNGRY